MVLRVQPTVHRARPFPPRHIWVLITIFVIQMSMFRVSFVIGREQGEDTLLEGSPQTMEGNEVTRDLVHDVFTRGLGRREERATIREAARVGPDTPQRVAPDPPAFPLEPTRVSALLFDSTPTGRAAWDGARDAALEEGGVEGAVGVDGRDDGVGPVLVEDGGGAGEACGALGVAGDGGWDADLGGDLVAASWRGLGERGAGVVVFGVGSVVVLEKGYEVETGRKERREERTSWRGLTRW